MAQVERPWDDGLLDNEFEDHSDNEIAPPNPPARARQPPRFSNATKALIGFWLVLWAAYTVALWFNQSIGFEEAEKLADRYRVGLQDVYVRTNVVFGADGTVLHEGKLI
ncbi:hypothetical protein BMF94_3335 [Rhodotorula taiwanensis]|uniref:Uncharacterized protein n=1 Tax=Rhodotorula taiwanensis TaxID=741276 RepID=A0A2S5BAK2_9BASI|nr:hypothetical protein BMF94_3335 [Rhodotorula taiwanensis]